jgi:hypothetical protein
MQKISLFDLARLSLRETEKKCLVEKGDIIRIISESDSRDEVIGLVTKIESKMMCLMLNNSQVEWWSRFVKCDKLS